MQLSRAIRITVVAVVLMMIQGADAMAQSENLGTLSPYTMYGVGEINTPGTLTTRSMGGAGAALRSTSSLNLLNPAAQGTNALRKSILFNFGADGGVQYLSQNSGGEEKTSAFNSYNIRDLAVQIPLYHGLGMAISVTPYSSVGYAIYQTQQLVDLGEISYVYSGSGGLNEARMAFGYSPHDKVSVGIAARFLWGTLQRTFSAYPTVITGNGVYSSTLGSSSYTVTKMMVQLGALWSPLFKRNEALTFGVTYDFGGNLNPEVYEYIYGSGTYTNTIAEEYLYDGDLVLPGELTAGVSYQNTKITIVADYTYKNWGNVCAGQEVNTLDDIVVSYINTSTFKVGAEYIPSRNDIRSYAKRIAYRAGARYGDYYQSYGGTSLSEFAVTTGVSLPIKYGSLTRAEVGFEFGGMGSKETISSKNGDVGLIKQRYIKFSVGLTLFGDDYWFQRVRYD